MGYNLIRMVVRGETSYRAACKPTLWPSPNRRSSVVEYLAFNQVAAGSTPAVGIFIIAPIADRFLALHDVIHHLSM